MVVGGGGSGGERKCEQVYFARDAAAWRQARKRGGRGRDSGEGLCAPLKDAQRRFIEAEAREGAEALARRERPEEAQGDDRRGRCAAYTTAPKRGKGAGVGHVEESTCSLSLGALRQSHL